MAGKCLEMRDILDFLSQVLPEMKISRPKLELSSVDVPHCFDSFLIVGNHTRFLADPLANLATMACTTDS